MSDPALAVLRCPECGVPLELGHDCLAGEQLELLPPEPEWDGTLPVPYGVIPY